MFWTKKSKQVIAKVFFGGGDEGEGGDFGGGGSVYDSTSEANARATLAAEQAMSPGGTSGGYLSALADVNRATPAQAPSQDYSAMFAGLAPASARGYSPMPYDGAAGVQAGLASQQGLQDHVAKAVYQAMHPEGSPLSRGFGSLAQVALGRLGLPEVGGYAKKGIIALMKQPRNIERDLNMTMVDDELGLGYAREPGSIMTNSAREAQGGKDTQFSNILAPPMQPTPAPSQALEPSYQSNDMWQALLPKLMLKGKTLADVISESGGQSQWQV